MKEIKVCFLEVNWVTGKKSLFKLLELSENEFLRINDEDNYFGLLHNGREVIIPKDKVLFMTKEIAVAKEIKNKENVKENENKKKEEEKEGE